uniref:ketopantoate reductase family protein n=1 Tax=Candidatus Stercorousia sp. TaxID=3048886 RepID=UPI004025CE1C
MRDIKNVLICGLGAIGSIYADKIQKFNPDSLRVLVDEERFERYSSNPIIFNGNELHFNYILPNDNGFKADLVIIATKYDGLSDVIKNMKNFIQSDTVILALLNGVTSEKIIAETYGREKLLYSYFIGHSAVRTGRNVIHDDVNTIVYGSENTADIENVQRVKKYFDSVGINYKIPEDIMHSLWLKYMLNVSANQSTAILRLTFGEMLANEKCMDFVINIMKEVQKIAKAEGVKNTDIMIDETIAHLHTMIPDGKTSMLQDVEAGRKTEVDMFAGTVIELGLKHNIQTPYNQIIKEILDAIYQNEIIKNSQILTKV